MPLTMTCGLRTTLGTTRPHPHPHPHPHHHLHPTPPAGVYHAADVLSPSLPLPGLLERLGALCSGMGELTGKAMAPALYLAAAVLGGCLSSAEVRPAPSSPLMLQWCSRACVAASVHCAGALV